MSSKGEIAQVRFDRHGWQIDGRAEILVCGEVHYFRVESHNWSDRLRKLKESGANAVSTYMPWLLHEPEEGRFDFTSFDIERFLEVVADMGLWLIARPGPYQYSELVRDGLPRWLWDNYPQLRAKRADGNDAGRCAISYSHPLYLSKAARWFDAILPRLVPHMASRGGSIIAVQLDNELLGVCGDERNPETFGIGRETGLWPDTVRRRGSIAQANMAYGTRASSIAEIRPPEGGSATDEDRRLARDWQGCFLRSVANYAATLTRWMREAGVDVPIIHNASCPEAIALFREILEACGPGFAVGTDHYWNLDQDWAQNSPTPQWLRRCAYALDIQRSWGLPPSVWEMPAGSLSDWPPVGSQDLLAACMSNLAYGLKAVSYYVFAGGPNPPQAGANGELYDYGAPIDLNGDPRPHYKALTKFADFLHREPWLAGAERVVDCRIVADLEHARAWAWFGQQGNLLTSNAEAMDGALKGVWTTASCAGWSPEFIDPLAIEIPVDLPLLVPSSCAMPRRLQQKLASALNRGARLLITPVLPSLDEDFQPCTVLAQAIGGGTQRRLEIANPRVAGWGIENIPAYGPLFASETLPPDAEIVAKETGSGATVGWRCDLRGNGRVIVWGQVQRHGKSEHLSAVHAILVTLAGKPALHVDNPNVWAVLRSDGTQWLLFLTNLFTDRQTVRVRFAAPDGSDQDTGELMVPAMTVATWPKSGPLTNDLY